ncbi:trehalase-like domain-containing protein, partial [Aurantimonas marianensis]
MSSKQAFDIPSRIADHGVIGDMRTLALVAIDGTIDFFCHPSIDSPTLFAGLLDPKNGGFFRLAASGGKEERKHRQMYLPDTNILITRFLDNDGIGEVCDFMPVDGSGRIVRRAKAIMGAVTFELTIAPRPDYGRRPPVIQSIEGGFTVGWEGSNEIVYFYTEMLLEIDGETVHGTARLAEGETCHVAFCPGRKDQPTVDDRYVAKASSRTRDYWHEWVQSGTYPTFWRDLVVRSALTLKLLTSSEY